MNSETILKTISDSIDLVAKKLGVAGDLVYPTLLKQANYQLVMDIIWIIVGLIILGLAIYLTITTSRKYKKEIGFVYESFHYEEGIGGIFAIIGIIILYIIGTIMTFWNLSELIQILINPNWYILQLVKEMVG